MTQEQRSRFNRDGYLIVPSVLSGGQVERLRTFFRPMFDRPPAERHPGDTDHILFNIFVRYPEVRWLLFHRAALQALRSLLGDDLVLLRESAAHLNHFAPWHKDTTAQERAGYRFHLERDYLMVEAGYYLQENSVERGGGLDVEPGTHLEPDTRLSPPRRSLAERAWHRLRGRTRPERPPLAVPTKPGDLLIFDFRLNHRASVPSREPTPEHEKMAIFMAWSTNSRHVASYHEFIGSRRDYAYLRDFSYPDDLLLEARAAGLNLA